MTCALLLALTMCFIEVAFYAFSANIALFMDGEKIGGTTEISRVVSIFMISGFVSGLLMKKWNPLFQHHIFSAATLMMALGYGILTISKEIIMVCLGGAFVGASFSILYSCIFLRLNSKYQHASNLGYAVTWVTTAIFIGQFISPFVLMAAEYILGYSGYRFRFFFLFGSLSLAAMMIIMLTVVKKKHCANIKEIL